MILLDTNVLVYAAGVAHPLKEPSRQLIAAARDGALDARTTTPILLELLYVWGRRRARAEAADLVRSYRSILIPLPEADDLTLGRATRLFERHHRLQAADAHLAAIAIELEADFIVSADRGFDGIPGLIRRAPDDPALTPYLGAG